LGVRIVAVVNQKGGVGKTTTAIHLAAGAAEAGRRVLLVDLDPQANATSGLGLEHIPGKSLYPVLVGRARALDMLQPSRHTNLKILASELDLAGAEMDLAGMENPLIHVRQALDPLHPRLPAQRWPPHDQRPRRCRKDPRTRPVRIFCFGGGWKNSQPRGANQTRRPKS